MAQPSHEKVGRDKRAETAGAVGSARDEKERNGNRRTEDRVNRRTESTHGLRTAVLGTKTNGARLGRRWVKIYLNLFSTKKAEMSTRVITHGSDKIEWRLRFNGELGISRSVSWD